MPTTTSPSWPPMAVCPQARCCPKVLRVPASPCASHCPRGTNWRCKTLPKGPQCAATASPSPTHSPPFPPAPVPAGGGVHDRRLRMPLARALHALPLATGHAPPPEPLTGYTFEGYRNADGSVGTRNILAITTTVQCVA